LPAAVHSLPTFPMDDGQSLDNMLVVNERMLLMENLGATKYLDRVVQRDHEEIEHVHHKVEELEIEERRNSSYIIHTIKNMGKLIMSEDFREGPRTDWVYCGLSICGLGPAWSVFVMGFFFTPAWFLGSLYINSKNSIKKAAGVASILMLCVVGLMLATIVFMPTSKMPLRAVISCIVVVGVAFLASVAYYKREQELMYHKILKRKLRGVIPPA